MKRLIARLLPVLALGCVSLQAQAVSEYDTVTCPAGQSAQMTLADFERLTAPYKGEAPDPLPPGTKEHRLPVPKFFREAALDRDFPMRGDANAVLLQGENGKVDLVLVPCASSPKLVEPIITAMSKAKLAKSTRNGKPVKAIVVVPVRWGY
jgi:hypothetical protein